MPRVCCGILSFDTTFIENIKSCKKKKSVTYFFFHKKCLKIFSIQIFRKPMPLGFLLTFFIKYKENGKKMKRKKDNF